MLTNRQHNEIIITMITNKIDKIQFNKHKSYARVNTPGYGGETLIDW